MTIGYPTVDGFGEEVRTIFAKPFWPSVALFTTWLSVLEVLPVKLESPAYTAVIG